MKKLSTKTIALIALMTAVICVLGPLALPIGPVPIALANLGIYFTLYILGTWKGTISVVAYIVIGLIGVPVFAGFTGGPGKLLGPTGGYIIGYIPLALIAGFVIDKSHGKFIVSMLGMILGTIVLYTLGTAWLAVSMDMGFGAALMAGVIPFIPGDLIKMVLASVLGVQIRKILYKADLA